MQGRRQVKKYGVDIDGECAEHESITGSGRKAPSGVQGQSPWSGSPLHSTPLTERAVKPRRQGHIGGPIAQP